MITIKAPVPWKCSVQVAKNRLEQVLMVTHPVIRAINMLWHNLYENLVIVDSSSFYSGDVPFHAENITEMIHTSCRIARDVSIPIEYRYKFEKTLTSKGFIKKIPFCIFHKRIDSL